MKKFTLAAYDAMPVMDGWRECPPGDYTAISAFGAWSIFGARSSFGEGAIFGARSNFGDRSSFGAWSNFGDRSSFGAASSFGAGAIFGEGCKIDGTERVLLSSTVYSAGGFGSANRTTYGFAVADGVWVRCGCWAGMLDDFRARVREVHGGTPIEREYLLVADLFEARRAREEKGGGE